MPRCILVLLLSFTLFSRGAQSQSFEHDFVNWSSVMLTAKIGESPWAMQFFAQSRMIRNLSQFQTVVLQLFGTYRIFPSTSIGVGYIYLTPINNRVLGIFSFQVSHNFKVGEWSSVLRLRAESLSWHSPEDDFFESIRAWRFRIRPEIAIPIGGNFSWLINNEWFLTAEPPVWNQNRVQTGIRYRESGIIIDVLYQHRILNRIAPTPVRVEHTLLLNFFYTITI